MSDETNLEELALLLDQLERELAATTDPRRRKEIATEISELTLRLSHIKTAPR
jgi:hypothetical protein